MNTEQNNFSLSCNSIAISYCKENGEKVKVNNHVAPEYSNESFLDSIEATVGNLEINPENGTISYMSNGKKVTINQSSSETFRKVIRDRKEKMENRDNGR